MGNLYAFLEFRIVRRDREISPTLIYINARKDHVADALAQPSSRPYPPPAQLTKLLMADTIVDLFTLNLTTQYRLRSSNIQNNLYQ